jgi:acyl carrier protein
VLEIAGSPDPIPSIDAVVAEVARVVNGELGLPHVVTPEARLQLDLALDSLSLLTLVVALEDRFKVMLQEEDAAEIVTVAHLAALVVRRAGEQR